MSTETKPDNPKAPVVPIRPPVTLRAIAEKHPGDFAAQAAEIREALTHLQRREAAIRAQLADVHAQGQALAGALEAIEAQIPATGDTARGNPAGV